MLECPYKAWLLSKEQEQAAHQTITFPEKKITPADKIALTAFCLSQPKQVDRVEIFLENASRPVSLLIKPSKKATQLTALAKQIFSKEEPPPFYKNKHCPACIFKEPCYKKLKEKECISLLGSISPKIVAKYHKKGIFSITQLSHLFRPRRRSSRKPKIAAGYMWELKAFAIREQKTFIMYTPELTETVNAIYIDFEGLPDEHFIYLIGVLIKREHEPDLTFSFWANTKEDEKEIFHQLFAVLNQYSSFPVYHYGSYESKALKAIVKKHPDVFKKDSIGIEKRMVNILSYLRTYVYPPTYSNGLKEIAGFLGFTWTEVEADGLQSLQWRKQWERTHGTEWKQKLTTYNTEDCKALERVNIWLAQLTLHAEGNNVQLVSEMKKQSAYKFQKNDYNEDFSIVNKAAYFDYQRSKIYWRNKRNSPVINHSDTHQLKKRPGKGVAAWAPTKAHEIIIAPPLPKCPSCNHTKLYQLKKYTFRRQTDIKFTTSGIKQHITEYRSSQVKCAKCQNKFKVRYIWQIIRNNPVIHIDETSVKLSKDKGYVWVFATSHTVFYHFTFNREPDFLKEWLKDYQGVIVTDFYPGYDPLTLKRQKCLIHLIRDLNDDLYKNPFDTEYKELVIAFGKLLRIIIETVDRHGLQTKYLIGHQKDTEEFYHNHLSKEHHSELSIKYAKRLKKHWEELWIFLQYDDVPWNNNNAEVAVKAFAQYRRGVNGQVGEKGLREYLDMLSLAQTCRYRNISYLKFLRRKAGLWENIPTDALPGFLPFEQAKQFIHRLGFERKQQWTDWKKAGKRPAFIPSSPERVYKNTGWISWHDWLGFSFMPFTAARTYMRRLGLKNRDEYWAWLRSGKRPKTIPYSPEKVYKRTGWIDLGDWLGTGNTGQQKKKRMPYEQAKKYVQALGIKTQHEFFEWRKSGQRPDTIPPDPNKSYFEFKSWGEFLGTNRIANQDKEYRSYEEAKAFLKPLHINSQRHFIELYELGIIPADIPKKPFSYYSKHGSWISFPDFLGKIDSNER